MPRIPTIVSSSGVASQIRGPVAPLQQTPNRQVNDLQRQTAEANSAIKALPFGDGNMIKDVSIPASGSATVSHRLGRTYQGYQLMHVRDAAASGVFAANTQDHPEIQIVLSNSAGAATLCDVWVY